MENKIEIIHLFKIVNDKYIDEMEEDAKFINDPGAKSYVDYPGELIKIKDDQMFKYSPRAKTWMTKLKKARFPIEIKKGMSGYFRVFLSDAGTKLAIKFAAVELNHVPTGFNALKFWLSVREGILGICWISPERKIVVVDRLFF